MANSCGRKVLFVTGSREIISTAYAIMSAVKNVALITVDNRGFQDRALWTLFHRSTLTVWLATNPRSGKVVEIKRNKKVSLYYWSGQTGMLPQGIAELVNAKELKEDTGKRAGSNYIRKGRSIIYWSSEPGATWSGRYIKINTWWCVTGKLRNWNEYIKEEVELNSFGEITNQLAFKE